MYGLFYLSHCDSSDFAFWIALGSVFLLVRHHGPGLPKVVESVVFSGGYIFGFEFEYGFVIPYLVIQHVPVVFPEGDIEFFHGYFRCLRSILRALR